MQAEMRERAAQAEAEGMQGVRLSRLQAELADALALADRRQLALATAQSDADEAIAERRRAIAAKEESDERLRLRDARSQQALDEALGAAEHTNKMQASAHADEVQAEFLARGRQRGDPEFVDVVPDRQGVAVLRPMQDAQLHRVAVTVVAAVAARGASRKGGPGGCYGGNAG
jgi:hypothetical protein